MLSFSFPALLLLLYLSKRQHICADIQEKKTVLLWIEVYAFNPSIER